MTTKTKTEKQVAEEKKKEEVKFDPSEYSCEIILEKTTKDKAEDRKFPTDAFIVRYLCDGTEYLDVTRSGKQANVFDMYYDRYGKGSLKKIDYGSGTVRPNLWGVKQPPQKKARKKR